MYRSGTTEQQGTLTKNSLQMEPRGDRVSGEVRAERLLQTALLGRGSEENKEVDGRRK